jgi:ACS family hexuronate transporter-like MFS transporter
MSAKTEPFSSEFTANAPDKSNVRWFVCFLLFLATTINYMDRSVFSLIEPLLHLPFMGWIPGLDHTHQPVYDNNFGNILIYFQIAYGVGFLFAGRVIDKLGTKTGYALAILVWACASISHSLVGSVMGFCIARVFLGLGESGNFPAAIKATTEWFPTEERAKAVGLFNSGSNASAFIAPVMIAAVTAKWGWHAAFICTGSMGLVWCVIWLIFPYNKLRRASSTTQRELAPVIPQGRVYRTLFTNRGFYAFCLGKGITDPIWWFYLFYLPKFLHDNYNLDLNHVKYPLIVIYTVASIGSIGGGWLSGFLMNRGYSINAGRKTAMLICALCVTPIIFVPYMGHLFPTNPWPAIGLFCLATAAHQGWSANIFSTPGDMFPSTAISTVVGIGGAAGAAGGAAFTWVVKRNLSLHQLLVFAMAAGAYIIALIIFQILVPRLGSRLEPNVPEEALI